MEQTTFPCPRCFAPLSLSGDLKFCPRCGLADPRDAAFDLKPLEVTVNARTFRVMDRIAIGSVCTVYRCRFQTDAGEVEGVFKIARDPRSNHLVANEATYLRRLYGAPGHGRFTPFLPRVEESFLFGETSPRQANVLCLDGAIHCPDELFTLSEVRAHYPAGLDGRDVAWIWRRLLAVLGFVHAHQIVHTAVLPMHVMIEPKEHKLVLIDWCCAAWVSAGHAKLTEMITGGYADWYQREAAFRQPLAPVLDVAMGARCMIELLGGDPVRGTFPDSVDPALQRHFGRLLGGDSTLRPSATRALEDFDRLIDALWGPRTFRQLTLPNKLRT